MIRVKQFIVLWGLLVGLVACGGGSSGGGGNASSTYSSSSASSSVPLPTSSSSLSLSSSSQSSAVSSSPTAAPEGGVSVINTNPAQAGFWAGDNEGAIASRQLVSVEHSDFSQATRIAVTNPGSEFWNGQLQFPSTTSIAANDVVLVHFYMRSVANTYETGNSFVTAFLEDNTSYAKFFTREVTAAADWEEYFIPVVVTTTQAVGNLSLKFGFGSGDRPQTFDIAGVELLNYGNYDISRLPQTRSTYDGRAEDASWRAAANARIEQHRKGDFVIRVVDANDNPLEGAAVAVEFDKHAYHFGSVTVGHILMDQSSADAEIYRQKVLELFNQSGPENDLKWAPWAGEWGSNYSKTNTLGGLQWLRDHGFYTRGHVMVWPSKRNLPNLIQDYLPEDDPENADPAAKQLVLDHISDIGTATSDYVDEWDVLNEPYDNHYLMDAFGKQVMVDWFNQARIALPAHGLYLNDYAILSAGGRNTAHQNHFEETLRYLLNEGAPVTGMGMQSHFGDSPTGIARVYEIVEQFHTEFPSLSIRSTEFDVTTEDEALQADYTRDFVTIFFSHPATVGVQLWGFWAGAHHSETAAMYTLDWQEKPAAAAWKNLIFNTWWNDFNGTTSSAGQYADRGFYGEYTVRVTHNGETRSYEMELLPGGDTQFNYLFE